MFGIPFLDLPPLSGIGGTVRVPGSKSISNRALLLAGFASGTTTIEGLLRADDTDVMLAALRTLGCRIDDGAGSGGGAAASTGQADDAGGQAADSRAFPGRDAGRRLAGRRVFVNGDVAGNEPPTDVVGLGGRPRIPGASLDLGNAGTAMRPLAAALAIGARPGERFELRGSARMHERPIADLVEALRAIGARVDYLGVDGYPPLAVGAGERAIALDRPIVVRGDVSSQFLSGLLLALPLRENAEAADAVVEVDGELISKPYVALTIALLARFGIAVERDGWRAFRVRRGRLVSPGRFVVEGDASSASYFIAAGAIAAADAPLVVEGVGSDSIQGDLAFVDAVRAMGAAIEVGPRSLAVRRGAFPLRPLDVDANAFPDAAMTLAGLALFTDPAAGPTCIRNVASWRVKESDRLAALATECAKLGARVVEGADFLEIAPPASSRDWRAAAIDTYDDHRIAMTLSLAAFNPTVGASRPVRIRDPRAVGKTWPDYFERLLERAQVAADAVPVLAIDGPTASGKGTLADAVARALGYVLLDSGAVYRATAVAALDAGVDAGDEAGLEALASSMRLAFRAGRTFVDGRDVTELLRLETTGSLASKLSAWPRVRRALLDVQLAFRRAPGLVADGRDMGTVVFPDAELKVFLTAGAAQRAERRYKQLISKGFPANIDGLRADLEARDERDRSRAASPLKPAEGALLLDNSELSVDASVEVVLKAWEERRPFES